MEIRKAFTRLSDVLHLVIGLMCKAVSTISPLIAISILLMYLFYQATEVEPEIESYKDYIEFFAGYILGDLLLKLLHV